MRETTVKRQTLETDISLYLCLDGSGESEIRTGVGFLDHMLTLFARHSGFDLKVSCRGDTEVDDHHSVEDIGIALGQAFCEALGDKRGITRYGATLVPMDEALIECAVDISGRSFIAYGLDIPSQKIGTFDSELVEEFFSAFAKNAGVTLHLIQRAGKNSHHIAEGAFKAAARALRQAVSPDGRFSDRIPSTKGKL